MSWEVVPYNPATWERFPVVGSMEVNGPSLDLNFLGGTLDSRITFARASTATDGLYTDAAGSSYNSFALNAPRISTANGLLIEEQRTNSLKNSDAPATQTTASLAAGTYTLWVIGTGSATSSAGTAVGTGFGAATAGTPNTFTLTGAGTVTVTKSGTLTRFQLELGAFPTSYIPTTASTATRAKDLASMAVGNWFNPVASTLVVEAVLPTSSAAPNSQFLAEISDGTTSNKLQITRAAASNNLTAALVLAGVTIASLTVGTNTPGSVMKTGVSTGAAGVTAAANGASGTSTASTAILSGMTTLNIGDRQDTLTQVDGFIRRIRYWPRALSQNDLNGATA